MAKKKGKRKKVDGKVHEGIAQAVAQLPTLLHVEVKDAFAYPLPKKTSPTAAAKPRITEKTKPVSPPVMKKIQAQAPPVRPSAQALSSRRKILWGGVTLMSALIFTLWAINMRSIIHDISDNPVPELKLIETAQADTTAIIEKIAPRPAAKTTTPEPGTTDALLKALNSMLPQTTEPAVIETIQAPTSTESSPESANDT